MATVYFIPIKFSVFLFILNIQEHISYKLSVIQKNATISNLTSHLDNAYIIKMCSIRDSICKSNDTKVCAVRLENELMQYKNFENTCQLFFCNMCDHPDNEYYIVWGGTCANYTTHRRAVERQEASNYRRAVNTANGTSKAPVQMTKAKTKKSKKPFVPKDTFDGHDCPKSCPNTYAPECVVINKGFGEYFKTWNFVNHCTIDLFYCTHFSEFKAPKGEMEAVDTSQLSRSRCGALKYIGLARFSEAASSMAHYGWLPGDFKATHILEPGERRPGYGKRK